MLERLLIALLVGIFGFLIGMFAWWELSDVFGSFRIYLSISLLLGAAGFLVGLSRPNETIDLLGLVAKKIWSFSFEVLSWFRFLR